MTEKTNQWPSLAIPDLKSTTDAIHLWSQVVGKIRLMLTPWTNHSWHVPLYLSVRGYSTGIISYGPRTFTIEFDLLADVLTICDSEGHERRVPLQRQSVASFYQATMRALRDLDLELSVHAMPCELPDAVLFDNDHAVRDYDRAKAQLYWRALLQIHRVFHVFRTRFVGKCSPIHLFWGSFDLAVTRFSGRTAPRHPGGAPHMPNAVAREAYSHEVSSAGFWPGTAHVATPSFYSYAYPAPPNFSAAPLRPASARFDAGFGEFLMPYDAVFDSADPDETLLSFLQSTYEAAANLAHWDRESLERSSGPLGRPPDENATGS